MKHSTVSMAALGVWLLAASTAFADVQLTMQNGRVSIKAKDATLRQIMTEWARVGQTKIVNVERIPGGPMTIELTNVPEEQALATLMRPLSGYMAAPRPTFEPNLSRFDRIVVMPTVAAARQPVTTTAAAPAPPTFQPAPQMVPQPAASPEQDDDTPPPNGAAAPRAPVFTTFPQPQVVAPAGAGQPFVAPQPPPQTGAAPAAPAPSPVPTMPAGVAVPGMLVPTPAQPGAAPGNANPTAPRRPGGQ